MSSRQHVAFLEPWDGGWRSGCEFCDWYGHASYYKENARREGLRHEENPGATLEATVAEAPNSRLVARVEAALEDYKAGRSTEEQFQTYLRRVAP